MPVLRRIFNVACLVLLLIAAVPLSGAGAQSDDTITIGITDLASALDPGYAFDLNSWETLSHLYTGLVRQVPGTLDIELALATDVAVSEDRLTVTFTLRDDATFNDGTPITAQTFVDSITRVITLEEKAADAVVPYVASIEAPSDTELIFTLTRPTPYFLQLVALPPYFPQHPTLAANPRAIPLTDEVIGNGPYLLESFAPREEIVLRANPDYTLGSPPATNTIVLRNFIRPQDLREALSKHEIDIAWRAVLLDDLPVLAEIEGLTITDTPSTRVYYLYMNHMLEPYDDPLVREALTLLVDRHRPIENTYQGYATPLTSMLPDLYPDAYADLWPDGPDVPAAEEVLLTAAYRPRGRSRLQITIVTSVPLYGTQIADVAAELSRGSFTLTDYVDGNVFSNTESQTFISALERGESRLALFAWTPIVPHPDAVLRPLAHSQSPIPFRAEYARPEIDALLDSAAVLDDPTAQGELYQAVAASLLSKHDIIPLWQEHIQAIAWDDISGVVVEPNFFLHYDLLTRN